MAVRIKSLRAVSNFPNSSVYIQGVTTATITVEVEPTRDPVTSVSLDFGDDQTPNPVNATETSSGIWTATRANTNVFAVNIYVTANDGSPVPSTRTFESVYTVKEHGAPYIDYTYVRCDANGDLNLNGGYIKITPYASANPSELRIANMAFTLYDGSTPVATRSNAISGVSYIVGGSLSADKKYTLLITATDNANTYGGTAESGRLEAAIPKVTRIINTKDGGTGLAFGQKATTDSLVDSAWDIKTPKVIIKPPTSDYSDIEFYSPTYGETNKSAAIRKYSSMNFNSLVFTLHHRSSDTNSSYTDMYKLPDSGTDNDDHVYNILTDKNTVTVAQGGTGMTTHESNTSISGINIYKWGRVVVVCFRGKSPTTGGSLGTLPAGYRPLAYLYGAATYYTTGNAYYHATITIESSGAMTVKYNNGTSQATPTSGYVQGTIAFITGA